MHKCFRLTLFGPALRELTEDPERAGIEGIVEESQFGPGPDLIRIRGSGVCRLKWRSQDRFKLVGKTKIMSALNTLFYIGGPSGSGQTGSIFFEAGSSLSSSVARFKSAVGLIRFQKDG